MLMLSSVNVTSRGAMLTSPTPKKARACARSNSVVVSRISSLHFPLRQSIRSNAWPVNILNFATHKGALASRHGLVSAKKLRGSLRVHASDPFENLFRSSVMQSEVVQQEFASLLGDLQRLSLIGNKFPEFDLEGKKMYLTQMETGIDKFEIFLKRLELAKDDANAQEFLRYSNAQMLNAGFTLNQFVTRLSSGLKEHRRWVEEEEKVIGDPEKHQQFKAVMRSVWGSAPMGRMDMNGVYEQISKLDPRLMMKAHSDPQFWVALTDITTNPSTASKWMDHPNIGPLACELWRAMQSSSWNQK